MTMYRVGSLHFKPIDFDLHSSLCLNFRADSFFCSFGTDLPFWEEDGRGGEKYLSWLKSKISGTYGAFHIWKDNKAIGQMELGQRKTEDNFGYINLYYLIPEERGKGYAKLLDVFATDFLGSLGFDRARLSVSPTNNRAFEFYKKCGWIDLGPKTEPIQTAQASEYLTHLMEKRFHSGSSL